MNKINYDDFHKITSAQHKIISKNNFTYRILLETINKYVDEFNPKTILDIGCGAGTLCLYLASKGKNVLGIDISPKAVISANDSAKILRLNTATFKIMQFPEEYPKSKFDLIVFTEVLEHLENDDLALQQIYSLLKKNGIAIVSTPSKNAPLYRLGLATQFDKKVGHLRRYTIKKLTTKCKKHGFLIIETKKTEGIIRNFLFINPTAGKFVRLVKYSLSDLVTYIDNISLKLFGESNIFVVIKKPN